MEKLVQRFALSFLKDGTYAELEAAVAAGDVTAAYNAAHTLKGVTRNLSFKTLGDLSTEMSDLLKAGNFDAAMRVLPKLKESYGLVMDGLNKLE